MAAGRPILIVEDDDGFQQVLVDHLTADGAFQSVEAATLDEAAQHLGATEARFDLVILDITLPDGDGRDFCLRMRRQGHKMPVIMLTGSSAENDVVLGLDAGANDYISKPLRANELLARIHAQLRLFDNSEAAVFTIGPYTFWPAAKLLLRPQKNQRIRLTEKEVLLLKFLCRAGNRGVACKMLLNEVWNYNAVVSTHTLESHIYRLRRKIEVDPGNPCLLVTTPGGYRLETAATGAG